MSKKNRQILGDHKKIGKRLVPPFVHMLQAPIEEVSWVKTIIPEICWLGLVQMRYGHKRGVEIITSIARAARAASQIPKKSIFGSISSYSVLSEVQWQQIRSRLVETGDLFQIQEALRPLIVSYPECPLRNLFSSSPGEHAREHVMTMKRHVELMFPRNDRDPTMFQASFVWLAFDAGTLKVAKGLALAEFPEIQEYPDTERSQKIASGVRTTLNMMFGAKADYPDVRTWPTYFWNRGLVLDECEFVDATT